jgi:SAM-dependent methyltransferase
MPPDGEVRLQHEIEHGATTTAFRQAEFGWDSPAGKIRRSRRGEFLVSGLPRDAKILKIGSGTGVQTIALLAACDDVIGIDISQDLLAVARQRAPGASYYVMDAHKPDFPLNEFAGSILIEARNPRN